MQTMLLQTILLPLYSSAWQNAPKHSFQDPHHHPDDKPTTSHIRGDLYCVDKIDSSLEQEQLKVWISEDIMRKYQRL
jgi:hypothetical protein